MSTKSKKPSQSKATDKPLASSSKAPSEAKKIMGKVSPTTELSATAAVDTDEIEEAEDATKHVAASSAEGGNAAAIAAANGSTEMSASFKNFRHHPDMENFYRFIYENDLRHEALAIIDELNLQKQQRRLLKMAKSQAH